MRIVFGLGGALLILCGLIVVIFVGGWPRVPGFLIAGTGVRMLGYANANRSRGADITTVAPGFGPNGAWMVWFGLTLLFLCLAFPVFGQAGYFGTSSKSASIWMALDAVAGLAGGYFTMRYTERQKTIDPSVVLAPENPPEG